MFKRLKYYIMAKFLPKSLPRVLLILDYMSFFKVAPPNDRISMLKNISRKHILYELTALNYRLKPKEKITIDTTYETQIKELRYFTVLSDELFYQCYEVMESNKNNQNRSPIVFTRQTCLFALEEIINSEEIVDIEDFVMSKSEVWDSIFKYLLAVNYEITQIKEEKDDNNINFETLNPKLLPLNELSIETDPFYIIYRGYKLINYFLEKAEYKEIVNEYFIEQYDIEPNYFVYSILSMYFANENSEVGSLNFHYFIDDKDDSISIFQKLSVLFPNTEINKLISVRKSPFINVEDSKFLLIDNVFLIEKAYSQFLNDFWWDKIKNIKNEDGSLAFNIKKYRSDFGYFFEKHVTETLNRIFSNYKYSVLYMFEQLKITVDKKEIEIADIYLRSSNKILLGQVKSGDIYDKEKFGGDVDALYKKDRNKFFENYGVNQLIESLSNMDKFINIIDSKFPKDHTYEIYPCIILNDKAFQTQFMAEIFNNRFQELLIGFNIKKVRVKPLTLIHISDIEKLEDYLLNNPKEIWNLIQFNYKSKFIPPFYSTIAKKLVEKQYPKHILDSIKPLIEAYNPEK